MKMNLPSFNGRLNIEIFLDWIHNVENCFDYLNILEQSQVKLLVYKLKGRASVQWKQFQFNRQRQGKQRVQTCPKMKRLLQR